MKKVVLMVADEEHASELQRRSQRKRLSRIVGKVKRGRGLLKMLRMINEVRWWK